MYPHLPHNHYIVDHVNPAWTNNIPNYDWRDFMSIAANNSIYLCVDKRSGVDDENNKYFTQVAAFCVNIDGVDNTYLSITDYKNKILGLDADYYNDEKTLEIPFWNGFSLSNDGSNPSWKNVKLGSKVFLEGIEYLVMEIKTSIASPKTTLTLHAAGQFENIIEPISITAYIPADLPIPPTTFQGVVNTFKSDQDLKKGNVVIILDNGKLFKAVSTTSDVSPYKNSYKLYGVVLQDAAAGEDIYAQPFPVNVQNLNWTFAIGSKIYLRNMWSPYLEPPVAEPDDNISDEPLTSPILISEDVYEDLYAWLGICQASGIVAFDLKLLFIHETPEPE
jgi:hypothetical protein